jgi:hypothetical protein
LADVIDVIRSGLNAYSRFVSPRFQPG